MLSLQAYSTQMLGNNVADWDYENYPMPNGKYILTNWKGRCQGIITEKEMHGDYMRKDFRLTDVVVEFETLGDFCEYWREVRLESIPTPVYADWENDALEFPVVDAQGRLTGETEEAADKEHFQFYDDRKNALIRLTEKEAVRHETIELLEWVRSEIIRIQERITAEEWRQE